MGDPYQLDNWHDPKAHYKKNDAEKMGMEQDEVHALHQDLMDYIYERAANPNVIVTKETSAGDACRSGKLNHFFDGADEIQVVGGNLTGCLKQTVKALSRDIEGPSVRIVRELTFDDDPEFWKRATS